MVPLRRSKFGSHVVMLCANPAGPAIGTCLHWILAMEEHTWWIHISFSNHEMCDTMEGTYIVIQQQEYHRIWWVMWKGIGNISNQYFCICPPVDPLHKLSMFLLILRRRPHLMTMLTHVPLTEYSIGVTSGFGGSCLRILTRWFARGSHTKAGDSA